jgi:hypothetical protein
MKNCTKERAGKEISGIIGKKEHAFFHHRILQKMYGKKAKARKEKQKGLIAKINANNLCQRKLF